jgi:hypothetical protein
MWAVLIGTGIIISWAMVGNNTRDLFEGAKASVWTDIAIFLLCGITAIIRGFAIWEKLF